MTGFVYDEQRHMLYMTAGDTLYRYSPLTKTFSSPIVLGGTLGDLDIAPDGSYLLVSQHTATVNQGFVEKISLASQAVTEFTYGLGFMEGGSADVAIVGQNTALLTTDFAGSGWTPFRQYDASTPPGAIGNAIVPGMPFGDIRHSSFLIASPDNRYVFVLENDISNAPMHIYDVFAGQIVSSKDFYQLGSSGFNTGHADINTNRGLVVNSTYNNIYVLDLSLTLVRDLSSLTGGGKIVGVHFTDSGDHLLLWNEVDDKVHVYDTHSWSEVATLAVATNVSSAYNGAPWGLMTLAEQGNLLALQTPSGFEVVDLGSRLVFNLMGGAGADALYGDVADDTLNGGDGDDLLFGGAGNDVLHGGHGNDTLRGGAGNDTVLAEGGNDSLYGDSGNDTLIGSSDAAGSLDGGDGNDVLWFYGATTISGGAGFDYAIQLDATGQTRSIGSAGIEVYIGNNGHDVIDATGATTPVILYGGGATDGLTLGDFGGYAFGQDGDDALVGGAGQDILIGGAGVDGMLGLGGNDVLYIDTADGLSFLGGDGVDYAIVDTASAVNLTLSTARGIEVFIGNLGNDVINASSVSYAMGVYGFGGDDFINGAAGASQLFGQEGNDTLVAGNSNDVVLGGNGNDQLYGQLGDDTLVGEAGDDLIVGGAGNDTLWGGGGNDTFRVAAGDALAGNADVIADFGDAAGNEDVINFTGLTAGQVAIINASGGALLSTPGGYSLLVIGATATSIQDDLLFT